LWAGREFEVSAPALNFNSSCYNSLKKHNLASILLNCWCLAGLLIFVFLNWEPF
jgi:hypothetical protein